MSYVLQTPVGSLIADGDGKIRIFNNLDEAEVFAAGLSKASGHQYRTVPIQHEWEKQMNTYTVPPGKYYIGDPCYCFDNHKAWMEAMLEIGEPPHGQETIIAFRTYGHG